MASEKKKNYSNTILFNVVIFSVTTLYYFFFTEETRVELLNSFIGACLLSFSVTLFSKIKFLKDNEANKNIIMFHYLLIPVVLLVYLAPLLVNQLTGNFVYVAATAIFLVLYFILKYMMLSSFRIK